MRRRIALPLLLATLVPGPSLAEETLFMRLESGLTALGYDAAPIDGLPDEGLSAAIARYKADRGLDPATPLSLQEFERLEEEVVASRTGSSEAPGRTPGSSEAAATPTAPPPGSAMGPGPTPPAPAPGLAAGGATDVCSMSPFDFLDALEGTWQVSHGPGFALVGGFGRQNFPAPAPITLTFTSWSNVGIGILSGDGQDLFMLPTGAQETAAHLSTLVQNGGSLGPMPAEAPCGWEGLPAMIGTNTYRLLGDGDRELSVDEFRVSYDRHVFGDLPGRNDDPLVRTLPRGTNQRLMIALCNETGTFDALLAASPSMEDRDFPPGPSSFVWGSTEDENMGEVLAYQRLRQGEDIRGRQVRDRSTVFARPDDRACRPPSTSADGNMEMTLILKFSSPRAATGIVVFEGRMLGMGLAADGTNLPIRFYAQTPVTMSR